MGDTGKGGEVCQGLQGATIVLTHGHQHQIGMTQGAVGLRTGTTPQCDLGPYHIPDLLRSTRLSGTVRGLQFQGKIVEVPLKRGVIQQAGLRVLGAIFAVLQGLVRGLTARAESLLNINYGAYSQGDGMLVVVLCKVYFQVSK